MTDTIACHVSIVTEELEQIAWIVYADPHSQHATSHHPVFNDTSPSL